jgi:branched-chain amino acid transport system substrate-binding protein
MRNLGIVASAGAMIVSTGFVLTSAATSAAASKLPTYEIGYEGPLSNGNAATGLYEEYGVDLAVKQWNANPKRHFNIRVVPGDDQGDPNIAPQVATGFVLNPAIKAVVGPAFSGATIAGINIYGANHMAEVSPSATRVSITVHDPTAAAGSQGPYNKYHNFFRVVANDGVQGPADGAYLAKAVTTGKILVVSDTSTYGQGLAQQVLNAIPAARRAGPILSLPYSNACTTGGTGTSDLISASMLSGVSAVFYGGYYCDFSQVIDGLRTTDNFTGTIMSGDGSDEPQVISGVKSPEADFAHPVLLTCACSNSAPASFNAGYAKIAHEAPGPYAAESYDAANLILTVMQGLKSVTRTAIIAGIAKVTYKGITKTIKFNKAGDVAGTAIFVNQIKGSGSSASGYKIVQLGLE